MLNVLIETIHYETTFISLSYLICLFPAKCPDPPNDIPLATKSYTTVFEDDTLVYDCQADKFFVDGSTQQISICLSTGEWSPVPEGCKCE